MKITDVEPIVVSWPPFENSFWTSLNRIGQVSELVVLVHTDEGIIGIGEAHGGSMHYIDNTGVAHISGAGSTVTDILKPLLIGENPLDNERLWSKMFGLTYQKGWSQIGATRQQILAAMAAVDIALWDIKGKAANMPVWRLLGGYRNTVPCYVTGGYYQDGKTIDDLTAECKSYVETGYNAIKLKIGGVSVEEDVDRVTAVREAVGPDIDIMVDVNEGYDVRTAIRAARLLEPLDIRWLEEPVHWYDRIEGLRQVADATTIPIASGEQALTRWDARDLLTRGGIKIMQFDCTRSAGITEVLKIAGMCAAQNVNLALHHDPQVHGHVMAALPNGEILETFPSAARDPIWAELFSVRPEIVNSQMTLLDRPGWGLELNEDTLEKRGVRG
ncbi:MAG: mandelate racemase/muconate lactonizing enzyme family protein [SAR202 cluster bacterium]|jgi:L-alanine-DL-glutamate epimerase-like enolase superfamily enzyme|nr:mandelate racemase/muconate lactonizing enzyme family protein [SAR202 cluster bacterium]|tara:strand:+ start:5611 stop:6771 length:1161 start_codon:yes stop_codon:yes gene_type:complete